MQSPRRSPGRELMKESDLKISIGMESGRLSPLTKDDKEVKNQDADDHLKGVEMEKEFLKKRLMEKDTALKTMTSMYHDAEALLTTFEKGIKTPDNNDIKTPTSDISVISDITSTNSSLITTPVGLDALGKDLVEKVKGLDLSTMDNSDYKSDLDTTHEDGVNANL
jgi:hypothetical protein